MVRAWRLARLQKAKVVLSRLSSEFTQISYTAGCYAESNVTRKMMCQQTCLQFAASENELIAVRWILFVVHDVALTHVPQDSTACNAQASFSAQRQTTLTTDFTSCTGTLSS